MRQMTLVAFLQAQNCSNYAASWRHAATAPDFLTADYYQRIARTLEAGRFHLAFFDDRLAMPDRYGDDFAEVEASVQGAGDALVVVSGQEVGRRRRVAPGRRTLERFCASGTTGHLHMPASPLCLLSQANQIEPLMDYTPVGGRVDS